MKITEIKKIDKKVIEYINSKTSNGYVLSQIIREELGDGADKKELGNKRKYVSKKLSSSGYKFNKEKKIYELAADITEKIKEDNEVFSPENEENNEGLTSENDDKPKRKYTKRSDQIKDNPLYYTCDLHSVISNIDYIYNQIQSNPKKIGIRLHSNIVDLFKAVESRYGYLDFYLLVNNAIHSCYLHVGDLQSSSWLMDYSNFISENESKEKKQVNLSSCLMIYDTITLFQEKFPILDRSEIVNLSLYVYAQCYLKKYSNKK